MRNEMLQLKKLSEYKKIVGIDLALSKSGVVIYDMASGNVEIYRGFDSIGKMKGNERLLGIFEAFNGLYKYLTEGLKTPLRDVLFVYEQLPHQCGSCSSVAALQGLAMAHSAMLVSFLTKDCDFFKEGIHSVSVRAVLKRLIDKEEINKDDIREYYEGLYGKIFPSNDFSDALAVIDTLLIKWNDYVKQEIKDFESKRANFRGINTRIVYDNWINLLKNKIIETKTEEVQTKNG